MYRVIADKLIRNNMPAKMIESGLDIQWGTLSGEKICIYLKQKIAEEALEALETPSQEKAFSELADLYTALETLLTHWNKSLDHLKELAQKKKEEKGGYDEGIHLKTIGIPENHEKLNHYQQNVTRYPHIPE